jgi:TatD DNase family protein
MNANTVRYPSEYTIQPPNRVVCLLHWGVLYRLLNLVYLVSAAERNRVCQLWHPVLMNGSPLRSSIPLGIQEAGVFVDSHFHLDDMISRSGQSLAQTESTVATTRFRLVLAVANYIHPRSSWRLLPQQPMTDPRVVFTVGIHPKHSREVVSMGLPGVCQTLSELLGLPGCVGLGEVGLDYTKTHVPIGLQRQVLRAQLALPAAQGRPLVLHCRDHPDESPGSASLEVLGILRSMGINDRPIHIHCFSGDARTVRYWLGFYPTNLVFFGFTSMVMDPHVPHVAQAAERVPLPNLLLESDAPYLSPHAERRQLRARGNHPWTIHHTLSFLAAYRGVPVPILLDICNANACVLYHITW